MSVKMIEEMDKWGKKETSRIEPRYCSKVRMGNWNEEITLQEEKMKYFLRKKDKGELMVQKTRLTLSALMKEIPLKLAEEFLCFGHVCQVVAPGLCLPRAPRGLALAGLVGVREVDTSQHLQEGSLVTATPLTDPCVRNCFRICSPNGCRDGERLTYGESFTLAAYESQYDSPLYIESEVPHLHSILGRSKHPLLRLTTYKNIYTLWRTVPLEHAVREDLMGTPVPANVPLVISHVACNKNLSVEPTFWSTTYFGPECEVSVNTELNVYRRETEKNVWMLINNRSSS